MEIGEKYKVKSFHKIFAMKTARSQYDGFYANHLFFSEKMEVLCNSTLTLKNINPARPGVWKSEESKWWWHEKWLEKQEFLSDQDFEI